MPPLICRQSGNSSRMSAPHAAPSQLTPFRASKRISVCRFPSVVNPFAHATHYLYSALCVLNAGDAFAMNCSSCSSSPAHLPIAVTPTCGPSQAQAFSRRSTRPCWSAACLITVACVVLVSDFVARASDSHHSTAAPPSDTVACANSSTAATARDRAFQPPDDSRAMIAAMPALLPALGESRRHARTLRAAATHGELGDRAELPSDPS